MIDYAEVSSDPHKSPLLIGSGLSNMPSPSSWMFGSGSLGPSPPRFDDAGTGVFAGIEAAMRLNEADYLINSGPEGDNLMSGPLI